MPAASSAEGYEAVQGTGLGGPGIQQISGLAAVGTALTGPVFIVTATADQPLSGPSPAADPHHTGPTGTTDRVHFPRASRASGRSMVQSQGLSLTLHRWS